MANKNETVEDIVASVRAQWQGCESVSLAELDGADLLNIIDRVEAARKRDTADLRRRLKVAEDALVVCRDGMCGECHRQHPGETCVNGCYEMSMAKNAIAAIREEKEEVK